MRHKMLIAHDGTAHSIKAVQYAADIVKLAPGRFEVVLLHILPQLPISIIEYGDLPGTGDEKSRLEARNAMIESLKAEMERASEHVFAEADAVFAAAGLPAPRHRYSHCTTDTAAEIIEEIGDGGYRTVVMGRKGTLSLKNRLLGDTVEKVVRYTSGCTVCVVE